MTKSEIEIGKYYNAKVSGALTIVRIENVLAIGKGWRAVNARTGRSIIIRTAQRLRSEADKEQLAIWLKMNDEYKRF